MMVCKKKESSSVIDDCTISESVTIQNLIVLILCLLVSVCKASSIVIIIQIDEHHDLSQTIK